MVKVSVIIPVYNAEKYLKQCLDSVLNQSLQEIEVICVDDGSTDDSPQILTEYASNDIRLRIVKQENAGPGKARNKGMEHSTGKYLIFLDADDWFEPEYLEKMYVKSEQVGADICICKAQRVDAETGNNLPSEWMLKEKLVPSDVFSPEEVSQYLFQFTYGQVWDKLYKKNLLVKEGIYFPELRNSEDMPFVYITLLSAHRVTLLSEVMVNYRVNMSSSVSNTIEKQPEAPFEAFGLVYEFLKEKNLYEKYKQSFLNWAIEYLVWQVCNVSNREIQRQYFVKVRYIWFPKLKIKGVYKYLYSVKNYCRYLVIRFLPFNIFTFALNLYRNCMAYIGDI